MELQPKRPPGRVDRKAAVFACEIVRLRSAGYTFEAIREALAELGIALSTSALRREVRRLRGRSQGGASALPSGMHTVASSTLDSTPELSSPAPQSRAPPHSSAASRESAEAFFDAHPSNFLYRIQETP